MNDSWKPTEVEASQIKYYFILSNIFFAVITREKIVFGCEFIYPALMQEVY